MAIASMLFGIAAGIIAFTIALFSGYGLLAAMGFYVLGGMSTTMCMIAVLMTRSVLRDHLGMKDAANFARS